MIRYYDGRNLQGKQMDNLRERLTWNQNKTKRRVIHMYIYTHKRPIWKNRHRNFLVRVPMFIQIDEPHEMNCRLSVWFK